MNKNTKFYVNIFWQMLKADIAVYKQIFIENFFDTIIWVSCLIIISTYIFPQLGMNKEYGAFIAVGTIVSCAFFLSWADNICFVSDLEGQRTIDYYLTLPIPSYLIFVKQSVGYAFKSMLASIIILPMSKLLLFSRMDLSNFSIIKFIVMFLSINIFTGFLTIFISSLVKNIIHNGIVWTRILFPLWFFGGSQFSWQTVFSLSPTFAYFSLLNPLLYPSEGIRVVVLGQKGYLPFWFCLGMMWFFSFLFGWFGIARLKKRLDFI